MESKYYDLQYVRDIMNPTTGDVIRSVITVIEGVPEREITKGWNKDFYPGWTKRVILNEKCDYKK